ncbi:MAG: ExbD/TolR family protein [Planctomycetaceae bacterium]
MRLPTRKRESLRAEDSMTPLIDVVFLLLIFFVCASVGQVAESLLPTELAAGAVSSLAPASESPTASKIWVYVRQLESGNLSLRVESRECEDITELSANLMQLAQLTPDSPVILDIGANVPLEALVDTWDICNRAGFESINFATSKK